MSRALEPKQFLNVYSSYPMIMETLKRVTGIIPDSNIYVAANSLHKAKLRQCIKGSGIPSQNFFFEPEGKNTLAPISILSHRLNSFDPEAVIVVLPCDHFIKRTDAFLKVLTKAMLLAGSGYIVTLGIIPSRAETGYGYIQVNPKLPTPAFRDRRGISPAFKCLSGAKTKNGKLYRVQRFIEKPDLKTARKFFRDKRYYWNGGIFVFKAGVIQEEIKKFTPGVYNLTRKIRNVKDLNRLWSKFPFISIDYAIMQKSKRLALLAADFGWQDLGSWEALEEVMKKDKDGNIFRGNTVSLDCKNTMVLAQKRLVAAAGLKDIILVDTKDAVLVCSKDKAQEVKRVVEILKKKKFKRQI